MSARDLDRRGEAGATGDAAWRKPRRSSLMANAAALPSVDAALDAVIVRAHSTHAPASEWARLEREFKAAEAKRREAEALRVKIAENHVREAAARDTAFRRELDRLHGEVAAAEARITVAMTSVGEPDAAQTLAESALLTELKQQLADAEERARLAQARLGEISQALAIASDEAAGAPVPNGANADPEQRVRRARATAAKALAVARAAAAGLSVSPADLAALESGVHAPSVTAAPPWRAIGGALLGGIALTLVIVRLAPATAGVTSRPAIVESTPAAVRPEAPDLAPAAHPPSPTPSAGPAQATAAPAAPVDVSGAVGQARPNKASLAPAKPEPRKADQTKAESAKAATAKAEQAKAAATKPESPKAESAKGKALIDPF